MTVDSVVYIVSDCFFTFMFYPFFFRYCCTVHLRPMLYISNDGFCGSDMKKLNQDGIKQLNKPPLARDRLQIWNSSNGLRVLNLKKKCLAWFLTYCSFINKHFTKNYALVL